MNRMSTKEPFPALSRVKKRTVKQQKRAIMKRIRAEVARGHGIEKLPGIGERLLVGGSQGSGKSRTVNEIIAALRGSGIVIWCLVPTHERAEEQAAEYRKIAGPGSLPVHVVRGRAARDLDAAEGGEMCRRHEVANTLSGMGVNVQETLCEKGAERCPFFDDCGYQRQRNQFVTSPAGLFIGPHEYVFLPSPAPKPDIAIVDESLVLKAPHEVSFLPHLLDDSGDWKRAGLTAAMDYRSTIGAVRDAPNRDPTSGSGHLIDIAAEFVEREGSCFARNVTPPKNSIRR
jgi:hypothetical protein